MAVVADAYVVDTGVFLRWFVDQDGFEHARELQQELALFVNLSQELGLPILTSDARLARAAGGAARVEVLRGVGQAI
jgi:hypothetical protein